jgi:hypothetical protein
METLLFPSVSALSGLSVWLIAGDDERSKGRRLRV